MENLLQIKKAEFVLGLKREYKFFQISDTHMANVDEKSSELDINDHTRAINGWKPLKYEMANNAKEFCDERYDIEPNILFEALTEYAKEINADAVIFSGDVFDRITDSNLRYMNRFLDSYPLPVIYCPGNHDWINETGEHLNLYDRIKRIVKNPDCDSYDFGEFEVVTIDNGTKQISQHQIEFLKEKLNGEKKILLVLHAPLYMGESGKELREKMSPYFLLGVESDPENAHTFNRLIKDNDKKLIGILAGHIHAFHEGYVTESLKQFTASSGLIGAGREIILK